MFLKTEYKVDVTELAKSADRKSYLSLLNRRQGQELGSKITQFFPCVKNEEKSYPKDDVSENSKPGECMHHYDVEVCILNLDQVSKIIQSVRNNIKDKQLQDSIIKELYK